MRPTSDQERYAAVIESKATPTANMAFPFSLVWLLTFKFNIWKSIFLASLDWFRFFFFMFLPPFSFCKLFRRRLRCWHYDDPVVEEATNVLREWGVIWNRSFVVSWIQFLFLPLDGHRFAYFHRKIRKLSIEKKNKTCWNVGKHAQDFNTSAVLT